jgi:hypothetical protein
MTFCGLQQRFDNCDNCGATITHDDICGCHECECGRMLYEDEEMCEVCRWEGEDDE